MRALGAVALVYVVAAALWLSSCAESSVLPPATPSPLPVDKIQRLAVACPVARRTQTFDGRPVTVHFAAPVASGGQSPVTVGCSPPSGSAFAVGRTDVTCGASDALQQTAGCVFEVMVLGPPKLAVTRFLAFGDSITAGFVSPPSGGVRLEARSSYPSRLEQGLSSRYVTQDISVVNAGVQGEEASEAVARFDAELGRHRPGAVLLMEGTNDLELVGGAGLESAAAALGRMAALARSAGIDTLLMTIPPQRGTGAAALVESFNNAIRSLAARYGAELIDVHGLLADGPCSGLQPLPCIGYDGVHPTAQGYGLIAEELERVLVGRYDVEILPVSGGGIADAPGMEFASGGESILRRSPR